MVITQKKPMYPDMLKIQKIRDEKFLTRIGCIHDPIRGHASRIRNILIVCHMASP
jgi:hypothetical protein